MRFGADFSGAAAGGGDLRNWDVLRDGFMFLIRSIGRRRMEVNLG